MYWKRDVNFLTFLLILISLIQFESFVHGDNSENNDLNDSVHAVVHIENGPIRGEFRRSYFAFEGIPYADPPIGNFVIY